MSDLKKRFESVSEIEPELEDLTAIQRIEEENDTSKGITLDEMDALRRTHEYSGKISLRVPKSLHRELSERAAEEGISLNQYALYKLAK